MKSSNLLSSIAAAAIYCATASFLPAFTITLENIHADADDVVGSPVSATLTNPAYPGTQSVTATDGANSSKTTADRSGAGDQVTLSYLFDHNRQGTSLGYAVSSASVSFMVASNTTYSASGVYAVNDVGSTSGDVYITGYLYDTTANAMLYQFTQNSRSTNDEILTVGVAGGDSHNSSTGLLAGNLIAGHAYNLYFFADIQAYPDADNGASATGNFTLKIGGGAPVASVPDAGSSVSLLALGLAGLAHVRRRLKAA